MEHHHCYPYEFLSVEHVHFYYEQPTPVCLLLNRVSKGNLYGSQSDHWTSHWKQILDIP